MPDNTGNQKYYGNSGSRAVVLVENTIDFSELATGASAADVFNLINVEAGDFVRQVLVEVQTVEGETLTVDVGDGTDADGFIDGTNGNAAGMTITSGAVGYVAGKLYTAADTIDLTVATAAGANSVDTAVIRVVAEIVKLG